MEVLKLVRWELVVIVLGTNGAIFTRYYSGSARGKTYLLTEPLVARVEGELEVMLEVSLSPANIG